MHLADSHRQSLAVQRWRRPQNVCGTYLLLSLQEVVLVRCDEQGHRHSESVPLFDESFTFSVDALKILLEATQQQRPKNVLHGLPIELQELILENLTSIPVERAKFGCELDIGRTFAWTSSGRTVEREEVSRYRTINSPVESQIWFNGDFCGLAYR